MVKTPKPSGPPTFAVQKLARLESGSKYRPSKATSYVESAWDKPHYTTQRPHIEGYETLNTKVDSLVSHWSDDFRSSFAGSDSASMQVTWETAANAKGIMGLRLINTESGADTTSKSVTIYGDVESSWSSLDLIRKDQRAPLVKKLTSLMKTSAPIDMNQAIADSLSDIVFAPDGSMVIRVPGGTLAPYSDGAYQVTVTNPQPYLSEDGIRTMKAAMASPTAPTVAPPSPSTQAKKSVDCAKEKCIALTFDDGPGPYTSKLLDELKQADTRATFFVLGPAVQSNPSLVRRMATMGMDIGNHTWSHSQLTKLSDSAVNDEISRTTKAIKTAAGVDPIAVRPPYGDYNDKTPHGGFAFIMWDDDTLDWKNRNVEETTKRALDQATNGGIILMHDIHPTTVQAVPGIIAELKKRGYNLVTVSQLLGKLDPSKVYSERMPATASSSPTPSPTSAAPTK